MVGGPLNVFLPRNVTDGSASQGLRPCFFAQPRGTWRLLGFEVTHSANNHLLFRAVPHRGGTLRSQ